MSLNGKIDIVKVHGGHLHGPSGNNIKRGPMTVYTRIINLYKAMYITYKGNVGKMTDSGNIITNNMLETIQERLFQLMGKAAKLKDGPKETTRK